jgi:hypothetical protein
MCDKLTANTVIENYEIELAGDTSVGGLEPAMERQILYFPPRMMPLEPE